MLLQLCLCPKVSPHALQFTKRVLRPRRYAINTSLGWMRNVPFAISDTVN